MEDIEDRDLVRLRQAGHELLVAVQPRRLHGLLLRQPLCDLTQRSLVLELLLHEDF